MKNVLIINGHQKYDGVAEGNLTKFYIQNAEEFLTKHGFNVQITNIEVDGYTPLDEVEKFKWADYFIIQFPVYWMGVPWIFKKYIDEVFTAGQNNGIYTNDGRSRSDASKRYGSGGLMQGKKYMLSLTYNCPVSEFEDKEGFFDGLSLDEAHIATHKTWQFCGAKPMVTYSVHDIFKGDLDLNAEKKVFVEDPSKEFFMSVAVVATLKTKDEHLNELSTLTTALHDSTHELDSGVLRYDLYTESSDKNAFVFLELWESQEALDTHLNSLHVKEFKAKTQHMLIDTKIKISEV